MCGRLQGNARSWVTRCDLLPVERPRLLLTTPESGPRLSTRDAGPVINPRQRLFRDSAFNVSCDHPGRLSSRPGGSASTNTRLVTIGPWR